jgi:oligoendopeptidase F
MAKALLKRSEMPAETLWDVQSVYPSDAAWEQAYQAAAAAIPGVARYQGRLG